ncbi:aminotransferase class V-fold PLP-dependent enzyme, partial [Gilvibacter sp.]|uniref:aminotransferase class V-fold PLP-dependent enzyme n=1 Tax=Gilvibacter sp. TaxID=2729997 RepID=UPI0035BE3B28
MLLRIQEPFSADPWKFEAGTPIIAGAIGLGQESDFIKMIHRISFLFFLTFFFAQEKHSSIHQEQLEKYKTKPDPTIEKVHVLTGLDVLLEKKQDLIQ